jgi:hypothetical protein
LCGRPSDAAAIREDFEELLSSLEVRGIEHAELTFGFAWANEIYPGNVWEARWLSVPEIRRAVGLHRLSETSLGDKRMESERTDGRHLARCQRLKE